MSMIRSSILEGMGVSSGANIATRINATGTGRLFSLLVKQTAGSLDGFKVELFSASGAVNPNWPEDNPPPVLFPITTPPELHYVIDPVVVAAAAAFGSVFIANGQPFYNTDTTIKARSDFLYVKITPTTNTLSKQFSVLITYSENDQ